MALPPVVRPEDIANGGPDPGCGRRQGKAFALAGSEDRPYDPFKRAMKVTYYLEVISSWCFWAEPAWAEIKQRYQGKVEFNWSIALMDSSGLPKSRAQCEWFYRRSGTIMTSPFMLNAGWFEPELSEYLAPNLVAEAAKDFGFLDDRIRLAIARAALLDGRKVGRWEESVAIAAATGNIDPIALRKKAESPEIAARTRASTEEFHSLQVYQRPAFVLENSIGDRAVFSGLATAGPIVGTIEAMLHDARAYAAHAAHFGSSPPEN